MTKKEIIRILKEHKIRSGLLEYVRAKKIFEDDIMDAVEYAEVLKVIAEYCGV